MDFDRIQEDFVLNFKCLTKLTDLYKNDEIIFLKIDLMVDGLKNQNLVMIVQNK